PDRDVLNELFLISLSRLPSDSEAKAMLNHLDASLLGVQIIPAKGPGVEIDKINPDSPAAKAGLKVGDVIRKIDAAVLPGADQFYAALATKMPSAMVTVSVDRAGQP